MNCIWDSANVLSTFGILWMICKARGKSFLVVCKSFETLPLHLWEVVLFCFVSHLNSSVSFSMFFELWFSKGQNVHKSMVKFQNLICGVVLFCLFVFVKVLRTKSLNLACVLKKITSLTLGELGLALKFAEKKQVMWV